MIILNSHQIYERLGNSVSVLWFDPLWNIYSIERIVLKNQLWNDELFSIDIWYPWNQTCHLLLMWAQHLHLWSVWKSHPTIKKVIGKIFPHSHCQWGLIYVTISVWKWYVGHFFNIGGVQKMRYVLSKWMSLFQLFTIWQSLCSN